MTLHLPLSEQTIEEIQRRWERYQRMGVFQGNSHDVFCLIAEIRQARAALHAISVVAVNYDHHACAVIAATASAALPQNLMPRPSSIDHLRKESGR